jgi:hypothetical protein
VVKVKIEPKTQWVVEVIGAGGRVDLRLGEFPMYRDGLYRSLTWSPEREAKVAGKK